MKKQAHVYYSGDVQGVGFRYTAERLANNLGITGWVKNTKDGKVELLAEGDEDKLKELLTTINKRMRYYIKDIDIEWGEATEKFSSFEIAFS